METRLKKKLRGPLPEGNRRGAPGADAGCFSIRTVSGEELSRRAPTGDLQPEKLTAEYLHRYTSRVNSPSEPYSPSTESYNPSVHSSPTSSVCTRGTPTPLLDVAREANAFLPASTKAGKPRVRMQWSKDVNIFIMRTYYYITKLETDMTIYRKKLHEQFLLKYPQIKVSEQRISDQRRTIERNKLLSQEILNRLKEEVKIQLQEEESNNLHVTKISNNTSTQTRTSSPPTSTVFQPNIQSLSTSKNLHYANSQQTQTSHIFTQTETITQLLENEIEGFINEQPPNEEYTRVIMNKFRTNLILYAGMDPKMRPKLPKLRYCHKLFQLTNLFNENILIEYVSPDTKLIDLHTLIYCTALTITEELNYKITENSIITSKSNKNKPAWQYRLEKDIQKLRADIGKLTQYINNNRPKKITERVEFLLRTTKVHTKHERINKKPEEVLDTLKQKLALKSHRLKRYNKAQERKTQNNIFIRNEKQFYRNLFKPQNLIQENNLATPAKEELEQYWAGIWEEQTHHNNQADWIIKEEQRWHDLKVMEYNEIAEEDIKDITDKLHNWKSPGIDKIHNFWFKQLTFLHSSLAKNISEIISGHQNIPEFIATGITYMLPKKSFSIQPSEYRPITCLPTIYKIITLLITQKINTHIENNNIIAEEQKGCRRGHMGCREQLIIDSTITKHALSKNRNLHCTYIDYKKAFDSIPHSWLLHILNIYKINPKIINFLRNVMSQWKTTLHLHSPNNNISTREIAIKKGIYQGDSLSPLWFCLALNPLSYRLQCNRVGYRLKHDNNESTISHLIYMDDIKLYSRNIKEMRTLIDTTTEFSKDIHMQFGLDKCRTVNIIKGNIQPGDYMINEIDKITAMEPNELYKYLGFQQLKGLNHTAIKETITNEYKKRINAICKTQLSSKHLIKALNTFAIPILTYTFGIIKWSNSNIEQIERLTRTTLTKHNNLHPKSAIERLTIKRKNGGRGLIDIKHLWQKQIHNLSTFFYTKAQSSNIHKSIVENDFKYTPLNLNEYQNIENPTNIDVQKKKIEEWKKKVMHGRHPNDLQQPHIDLEASNKWLKSGSLFPETEGFIIAIQDQIINTKNFRKYIIKDPTVINDKCRRCHTQSETIQHITGACANLTQTDYTHRHNQLVNIIHQSLANKHNLIQDTNIPYYKYTPKTILENTSHKIYYDRAILTDKTIPYNRPDITLQDKTNKIVYLIDVAVPNTHNIQKTIVEKINKYADLKEEITRIWKQDKVYVVPIVISTTGVIPKTIHHYLKIINLQDNIIHTLQKAAILNTCRIVRKFLQIEEVDINTQN